MQSAHQMLACTVTFPQTISTLYIQPKEKNKRRNFRNLELTGKILCVTGTTLCLPRDLWVKLLRPGKALPSSGAAEEHLCSQILFLIFSQNTLLHTSSLCWLPKPQRQLHLFMPQRAGQLISFIWSEELLSCQNECTLMVAPKLVTFEKESINSSNHQAIIFKKRTLKKIFGFYNPQRLYR